MALDRCDGVLGTGSLAAPAALGYGAYESTGAVAAAGSYAFLTDDDAVFTTYEGLHDGTETRLLIHTTDAGGTSHTASFDAVQAGDIFEWREAGDCPVRYIVDAVGPDPGGQGSRREPEVRWMTYAFAPGVVYTTDVAEARELTCWRALPDWPLVFASSGDPDTPAYSYCSRFHTDAVGVCGGFAAERPGQPVAAESGGRVTETRVVDGYPVLQVQQGNGVERALEVASGPFGAPAP